MAVVLQFATMEEVSVKLRFLSYAAVAGAALVASAPADAVAQVCSARATVRQIGVKPNDDGTRTLRYRATLQADKDAVPCTKVDLTVVRSYVAADGTTREEGIPLSAEVKDKLEIDGEDVLATSKLVYWRTERVTCEPCAGAPATTKAAAMAIDPPAASAATEDSEAGDAAQQPKLTPKKKKVLGALTVMLGVLLVL
jgi:hypothetical protein